MLRIGQLRAFSAPLTFNRWQEAVFIIDGAETMRWDLANVFLKILEEPPGSATLILTAPSPYSLLPTIVSRCLQFHFAPLPAAEVESILKEKSDLVPAAIRLAAQLSEGSPGYALELDAERESLRRRNGLKILERAARGEEFGQVFVQTNAISKTGKSLLKNSFPFFIVCSPTFSNSLRASNRRSFATRRSTRNWRPSQDELTPAG